MRADHPQALSAFDSHPLPPDFTSSRAASLPGPITISGDGGQSRDLINIRDVVRANILAADHPNVSGKVFNICTGIETRLMDLLEVLLDAFPNAPMPEFAAPRDGDIYRSLGSPQKASDVMGFQAQVPLEKGLLETLEWMRS